MRKLKLFFACLLMAVLSIGQMWAAEELKATLDFTSNEAWQLPVGSGNGLQGPADYSDGTYTVNLSATTKYYFNSDGYLMIGKSGSKITLPAFSWKTTKIVVTGRTGASTGTKQNIYVGETAVSTETTGCTGANTYYIASANQAAGNVYVFQVTSNHNAQVTKIEIYGEAGGDDPTPVAVTGVTLDKNEAEVAVGKTITLTPTVAPSNATTKTVTWESDDEDVATVDGGVVTGVAEGTATITVKTTDGNKTATCIVTVTAATPAPTDDADVVLDLLDGNWGLPTSGTNTELATFTNSVTGYAIKCYAATNYKVGSDYLIIGKANSYIELPTFSSPVEKIVVVKGNGSQPSGSVVFNIYDGNDAVSTAATGCTTDKEFEIENPAANKTYTLKITSNHNLQLSAIKIYFGEAPDVAKPTISGETPFLNTTSVSISIPEGTTVYYTTDGSDPKTSDTKQTYSAAFNLSANATVKAIATDGANWSEPVEKSFVKATVMTVAQARAAIDAGGDLSNKFVAGIISQIDSYNSTYNSITYWISDDGTTTDQLQVYSGLAGVVKSAFASKDDLAVGDDVTVKGTLKKYNSTYEFDYNNTIEAYKPIARLAWSAESYDASLEGANTFPTLTNTYSVDVTYSSSDAAKASFDDASVYDITLNAVGSTTITASFAGNETYKANSVSYTLNVASSLVTLTYNVDGGEAIDPVNVSALPNPLPTTTKAGKNFGGWFTDSEKTVAAVPGAAISENTTLYAKWLDPYTVAEAKTVIDANPTGIENQYVAGIISQIDSYNSTYKSITYWISADGTTTNQLQVYSGLIGNAATPLGKEAFSAKEDLELGDAVVVTGTLKLHNSTTYEFDKNNSIYTFSRKASAGLEYAETAIQKTVGDDLFTNPLTNPYSVTVTYSSSDEDVAEVDENTGEVLVGDEGTATITAAFAGNATYKAAEVSYTVTVSAAAPVLTDYYEKVTETAGITDGTYLIVYEADGLAFNGGLTTLDAESNTIAVAITNDNKIGVTEATAAATFFIDVTAGSILAANSKYIGVSSYGNGLKTSETSDYTNAFAIDGDGNAVISIYNATWNKGSEGTMILRYNSASGQTRFRYYKEGGQQPIALYKLANETVKANPELAWSGDVEITLGETFTAPTLDNPHSVEGITFASDNTDLATVTNAGVIELVADATGTAHITASFAGNDDYKAASVSCTIIVNASTPTPAETKNVVILAEYNSKFYAMTNSLASGALAAVEVEKDGDKIVVFAEADKAAIQWTMTDNTTTATFQDSEDKYLAHTGTGTSLALQDAAEDWTWHIDGYYYAVENRTFFYNNSGVFKNYSTSNLPADKTDYSGAPEIIEIAAEDIILSQKADPELAYDPAEVELTVGDDFTPAALTYAEGFDGLAAVTYESSNTDLATVEGGVVSLVADATGTATITATFAGNNNYLAGSASYTITVNAPAPVPTTTTYRKVTATDDITDGEYLIVYEGDANHASVAFDGALETLDAAENGVAVTINEGEIAGNTEIDAAIFTIDVTAGTLQSASGNYIGVSSNDNGLKQTENAETYSHNFSIDGDGNAVIAAAFEGSIMTLRYNYGTNNGLRFRYYKNNGQQAIQLYKKAVEPDYGSYQRTVTAGNYGTICLPQAGTIEGATLFEIGSFENEMIYVDEVIGGVMEAGKPYIFQATADQLNVTYTSDTQVAASNANGLHGFYNLSNMATDEADKFDITEDAGNYILYQNAYWLVSGRAAYINNFRAYIKIGEINPKAAAPGRRRVAMSVHGEQVATGFENLNASEKPVKLMIDGNIYILRGEKLYDASGRLVK